MREVGVDMEEEWKVAYLSSMPMPTAVVVCEQYPQLLGHSMQASQSQQCCTRSCPSQRSCCISSPVGGHPQRTDCQGHLL